MMKNNRYGILLSLVLLAGCAGKSADVISNVATSSDSEKIAYTTCGAGKTALVFIHGWSCDREYWRNQLPAFSDPYRVIAIDLAGHGKSSANRRDYTLLSFAKDVQAVLEKEKVDRAILIGHSLGGGVIAEAARLMPDKVVAIIGVDTFHNVSETIPQKNLDDMTKPFEADFQKAMRAFVSPMFPKNADQDVTNWVIEDMSSAPKEVAISAFRNYLGYYVSGEAARMFETISVPVISINARLWPSNAEKNAKAIKDYTLFYIEDAGHFPMVERPNEFNALLTKVLDSIQSKSETRPQK